MMDYRIAKAERAVGLRLVVCYVSRKSIVYVSHDFFTKFVHVIFRRAEYP